MATRSMARWFVLLARALLRHWIIVAVCSTPGVLFDPAHSSGLLPQCSLRAYGAAMPARRARVCPPSLVATRGSAIGANCILRPQIRLAKTSGSDPVRQPKTGRPSRFGMGSRTSEPGFPAVGWRSKTAG
jgi:hypothetical protein